MKTGSSFALCLALFLFGGCATYKIQDAGSPSYANVFVKPIRNDSTFPVLEATLTSSIRKAVDETGFISSVNENEADAILEIILQRVNRETLAVQAQDLGRGRKFELQFNLLCSLYKDGTQTAAYFANRPLIVRQDIFADSGQVNAEYQATPEVSRKIATQIANLLTDVW
ncbi:MAG: LPS assembly lipoprotein LptE [Verrucomicrobiota bacterium]